MIPITKPNANFTRKTLKSLSDSVTGDQARLKNLFSELKDTNQQIQQMIDSRSDDSSKWNDFRARKLLRDDISRQKQELIGYKTKSPKSNLSW